ncbi:hypothetical protein E4U44_007752, partial [Claviceps purpurea]
SDNKSLSAKLAEKIAEERAKALLRSVEIQKRPAAPSAAAEDSEEQASSKKRQKVKGKGKGKQR